MIQRIQSVYILLAFAFGLSMFFTQQISFSTDTATYLLDFKGISQDLQGVKEVVIPTIALSILMVLTPLIALSCLFLYKKRMIQIRLCAANIGLFIGETGLIYYFGTQAVKQLHVVSISYNITTVFPIAGAILSFLALRAIGKDEALIRSVDRIR